ncbi:DUF192 domain-containing protein [Candidatus Woesearchaeota archaeon]|nr:DUF192 domain-containing protein [Candidatus Woesearchaeota archaeon]MBW3022320.1 DUF192 domain-containing protein [Candidatus Woesearchaeota archaeon]
MLKINNKTITHNTKICRSQFSKFLGLMFSRKKDLALVFVFGKDSIVPLHMLFVFYSIDVLFLNKDKEIIEIKSNFKPFSFYTPKKPARFVIELPAGQEYKLGDRVLF